MNEVADTAKLELEVSAWLTGCGCARLQVAVTRVLPAKTLLAEEAAIVANAVTRRRNEFAAGRYCARKALSLIGNDELPLLRGPKGEPLWPESAIGSISHDQDIAIAVVARACDCSAIGIDLLHLNQEIDSAAGSLIAGHDELDSIDAMLSNYGASPRSSTKIDPLLFALSAKEAAIKNVSPGLQHFMDYRDCHIRCGGRNIEITIVNPQRRLVICWRIFGDLLVTLACSDERETRDSPGKIEI